MKTLFYNIKELFQVRENNQSILKGSEMKELPSIKNAFLLVENDLMPIMDQWKMHRLILMNRLMFRAK